jgi:hypothetical protein
MARELPLRHAPSDRAIQTSTTPAATAASPISAASPAACAGEAPALVDTRRGQRERQPLDHQNEPQSEDDRPDQLVSTLPLFGIAAASPPSSCWSASGGRSGETSVSGASRRRPSRSMPSVRTSPRPTARIESKSAAHELAVRRDHEGRVLLLHRPLEGAEAAVEGEELGIVAEGLGEDAVPFGIGLASGDLGLPRGAPTVSTTVRSACRADAAAPPRCRARSRPPLRVRARPASGRRSPRGSARAGSSASAARRRSRARGPPPGARLIADAVHQVPALFGQDRVVRRHLIGTQHLADLRRSGWLQPVLGRHACRPRRRPAGSGPRPRSGSARRRRPPGGGRPRA